MVLIAILTCLYSFLATVLWFGIVPPICGV